MFFLIVLAFGHRRHSKHVNCSNATETLILSETVTATATASETLIPTATETETTGNLFSFSIPTEILEILDETPVSIPSEIFKSFLTDSNRENVCTLVQTFCA